MGFDRVYGDLLDEGRSRALADGSWRLHRSGPGSRTLRVTGLQELRFVQRNRRNTLGWPAEYSPMLTTRIFPAFCPR